MSAKKEWWTMERRQASSRLRIARLSGLSTEELLAQRAAGVSFAALARKHQVSSRSLYYRVKRHEARLALLSPALE